MSPTLLCSSFDILICLNMKILPLFTYFTIHYYTMCCVLLWMFICLYLNLKVTKTIQYWNRNLNYLNAYFYVHYFFFAMDNREINKQYRKTHASLLHTTNNVLQYKIICCTCKIDISFFHNEDIKASMLNNCSF